MTTQNPSRRQFIKQTMVGGVAIYTAPLALNGMSAQAATTPASDGSAPPAMRFDAVAKVTGQKLYGRDFRAMDIEGWPKKQYHACVVRAIKVDHVVTGLDLSALPDYAKPWKVVTAADLKRDKIALPEYFGDNMLVSFGQAAEYYGHAVAILIFDDIVSFTHARQKMQFNNSFVTYGDSVTPYQRDPFAAWRLIRYEGKGGSNSKDLYSPVDDGLFFPRYKNRMTVWPTKAVKDGDAGSKGIYYANKIQQELKDRDWLVLEEEFDTQIVEPMMLEPEAGNIWFDSKNGALHAVICSQSGSDYYEQAAKMVKDSDIGKNLSDLYLNSSFIGGGFGAKDHTIFPYYATVAGLYGEGNPVRLANNRYEQFQSGLKRHAFKFSNTLALDKKTGKIQAAVSVMDLNGGGRQNFSPSVASVGASAIQGIYYMPRSDFSATAHQTNDPTAGSMRGYGTLQAMPTVEMMMNKAADQLGVDPIDLRIANAQRTGDKNSQGAVPSGNLRYVEMLKEAKKHEMWTQRASRKAAYEKANPDKSFGTGFSMVTKDYGTGSPSFRAAVSISAQGDIVLDIEGMEMGTGGQTGNAVLTAESFGSHASVVNLGVTRKWSALKIYETDSPYIISQKKQDKMAKDPRWVQVVATSSSASMQAYFQGHATKECCRIVFDHGLWPAAKAIWSGGALGGASSSDVIRKEDARWVDGKLTADGQQPLSLQTLAKKMHDMGGVNSAMVHTFNRWRWATADFDIGGKLDNYAIDALAVQYGDGADNKKKRAMTSEGWHLLDRKNMSYPDTVRNNAFVTYYSPAAIIVDVAVDKKTHQVEVLRTSSWLECGRPIVEDLVLGQMEGGLAMGIGHALLEELPSGAAGPGDGSWNITGYKVPFAKDVGVWQQEHHILPPLSDTDPNKGCAEVVCIPVIAAIQEGIYQATGARINSTPMTAEKIKRALS